MIEYSELVQYVEDNHINPHTNLFEILSKFFEEYYVNKHNASCQIVETEQQSIVFNQFIEPENGEYSIEDVLTLFST